VTTLHRCQLTLRRVAREQSGWTLIELLISTTLLLVILVAVLVLLDSANKLGPQDSERAHDLREAQVGVYGMTRELRQTYAIVSNSGYLIEAHVWVNGADHDVTYDCTGNSSAGTNLGQCIRYEIVGGVRGPSTVVIDRLVNKPGSGMAPVFAYRTNSSGVTTYGSAHVEVPSKGTRAQGYKYRIALEDAFYMRNLNG
jgi:Tfp pilus assembly protein PilW